MTFPKKSSGYLFALIPWLAVVVILISYLHTQVIFEYDYSLKFPDPRYHKLKIIYENIIWPSILIWVISIFIGLLILAYLIIGKNISTYKKELLLALIGHFVCFYLLTYSRFTWFID
jgi:hypothetical protein